MPRRRSREPTESEGCVEHGSTELPVATFETRSHVPRGLWLAKVWRKIRSGLILHSKNEPPLSSSKQLNTVPTMALRMRLKLCTTFIDSSIGQQRLMAGETSAALFDWDLTLLRPKRACLTYHLHP